MDAFCLNCLSDSILRSLFLIASSAHLPRSYRVCASCHIEKPRAREKILLLTARWGVSFVALYWNHSHERCSARGAVLLYGSRKIPLLLATILVCLPRTSCKIPHPHKFLNRESHTSPAGLAASDLNCLTSLHAGKTHPLQRPNKINDSTEMRDHGSTTRRHQGHQIHSHASGSIYIPP